MLKPKLLKSLIAQNASLLRQRQQFIDYLRTLESVLRSLEKDGRNTGIVQLNTISIIRKQILEVLSSNDMRMFHETGTSDMPTKSKLARMIEVDNDIKTNLISFGSVPMEASPEEIKTFIEKLMNDIINHAKNREDEEGFEDPSINPSNFGGDLEGEWQDFPPPPEGDPFGSDHESQ